MAGATAEAECEGRRAGREPRRADTTATGGRSRGRGRSVTGVVVTDGDAAGPESAAGALWEAERSGAGEDVVDEHSESNSEGRRAGSDDRRRAGETLYAASLAKCGKESAVADGGV